MSSKRISELQDGDRIVFPGVPGVLPDTSVALRKVWRYGDGSVVLEFKGRAPGMWRYDRGDAEALLVKVKG